MFEASYQTTFCATHAILDDNRAMEPLHGHDWRIEVTAASDRLNRMGVVVSFEHLKEAVDEVARRFHYGDITSHPHFAGVSPSAEAVARYFFEEVRKAMGEEGERVRRVQVWEAPGCSASFIE